MTGFRPLKRKEPEVVLQKPVADSELADDLSETLTLEARRANRTSRYAERLKNSGFAFELAR